MKKFTPGRYYFGDPCYVFTHEGWDGLLKETDYFDSPHDTNRVLDAGDTRYGDGTYSGFGILSGNSFPVDAGLLGVVNVKEVEVTEEEIIRSGLGVFLDMANDFIFEYEKGVFKINGEVIWDTNTDEDEF